MRSFTTPLTARRSIAEGTVEITLRRPDEFQFRAGQFLMMRVPAEGAGITERDRTRSMSIASAPHEPDLRIAMRIPDNPSLFKRTIESLPLHTEVMIKGPFGHLVLPDDISRPIVLIAGGIGIAPFRSIILDEIHRNTKRSVRLFYSNRTAASAPYLKELQTISSPTYQFQCILSKEDPETASTQGCIAGYLRGDDITRIIPDYLNCLYYIVGLPRMVTDMREQLSAAGISHENIHIELYPGY